MRVIFFRTREEQALGLQHRPWIESGVLFAFPDVPPGAVFHSQNVAEPFDIAFLSIERRVLLLRRMFPPKDLVEAPPGTAAAVEAKAGWLPHWGFLPGWRTVSI